MASQHFSLRWNNYSNHITTAFDSLRSQGHLVDVTLCCEGRKIRAHQVLLSACSTYFRDVFKENPCQHPVIVFKNVKYDDLMALIEFMYQGEVSVQQDWLASFLSTAEMLAVQGLTANNSDTSNTNKDSVYTAPAQCNTTTTTTMLQTVVTAPPINVVNSRLPTTAIISDIKNIATYTVPMSAISTIAETTTTSAPLPLQTQSLKSRQSISSISSLGDNHQVDLAPIKKRRMSNSQIITVDENGDFISAQEEEMSDNVGDDGTDPVFMKIEMPDYIENTASGHGQATTFQTHHEQNTRHIELEDQSSEHHLACVDEEDEEENQTGGPDDSTTYNNIDDQDSDLELMYTTGLESEIEARIYASQSSVDSSSLKPLMSSTVSYTQDIKPAELVCPLCVRKFMSSAALKRHNESKHTEQQETFGCAACLKSFKTKWSLSTHTSRFHRPGSSAPVSRRSIVSVGSGTILTKKFLK